MWSLSFILFMVLYAALTWRSLKEASSPSLPCPSSSTAKDRQHQHQLQQCFGPALVVGDAIVLQLELYQPPLSSSTGSYPFRWVPVETCRVNATIPPTGRLPELLTRRKSSITDDNDATQGSNVSQTTTESSLQQQKNEQSCQVPLPDFARHRSSQQSSVHPLMARFLVFHQRFDEGDDDGSHDPSFSEVLVGATDPFFLTRVKKREPKTRASLGSSGWNANEETTRAAPRNLIQEPFPGADDSETKMGDGGSTTTNEHATTMWIPYLKFGRNTPVRIRFVAEDRGYAFLQRADGIPLHPLNATAYSPILYVDELSLPHNAQVELAPPEEDKPPILLHIKLGSISPTVDAVNRQVHIAFETAESFLSGPELDEIRYFLQDERLYRFALTQVISYLHMWLDYLAFRDEIRFYRGRRNLSGVSSTTVLTRLACSVIIFLYLLDGGGTSWVVLISILASCLTEAWKAWKLLKPTPTSQFPFVKLRHLQSTKELETAEYDRIACRYLAMVLYPLVAMWSLYALRHYEYSSWYSWFISNMANAVYTFGFISLCPQLYINYRLKSVAHLPWKVFMYKIFNTFVDDAFAWLIEMPLKHRLMTLRDDVVFVVFLVQVYIYRVDRTRTNEFGYSYENEEENEGKQEQRSLNGEGAARDQEKDQHTSAVTATTAASSNLNNDGGSSFHFVVIVLGDVGRSPRMQYHANSLLQAGHSVSLVGYVGEDLIPSLQEIEKDPLGRLSVIRFSVPTPEILKRLLPLYLLWRITSLSLYLLHILVVAVPKTSGKKCVNCVLVQNPPAMPLLVVVYIWSNFIIKYSKGFTPAFVIDWHNLGFTMLSNPVFSKIACIYEKVMAPTATAHLCVTQAMKDFIQEQFHIPSDRISVLHDCSNSMFQPRSLQENHEILSRLHDQLCAACPKSWYQYLDPKCQTLFTEKNTDKNECTPRMNRPALITSSTSWTPDEDFGQLLDALVGLDECITNQQLLLRVLVVVTGKGPQKLHFLQKISRLKLINIAIQTLWLEPADYPLLLACADVGISLHTSTSGIDLPMKILDLFGCEVPVCARGFQCLPELVKDGVNGRIFHSSEELQDQLLELLRPLALSPGPRPPHSFGDLAKYSHSLQGRMKWDENWNDNALPLLESVVASPTILT